MVESTVDGELLRQGLEATGQMRPTVRKQRSNEHAWSPVYTAQDSSLEWDHTVGGASFLHYTAVKLL